VGPEEEPRRGRGSVMLSAPPDGRREDDDEGRRGITSEGRLEETGEKATAGVGGPSCPWSSMCSRFASSALKVKTLSGMDSAIVEVCLTDTSCNEFAAWVHQG
jgi:hypothetical protein